MPTAPRQTTGLPCGFMARAVRALAVSALLTLLLSGAAGAGDALPDALRPPPGAPAAVARPALDDAVRVALTLCTQPGRLLMADKDGLFPPGVGRLRHDDIGALLMRISLEFLPATPVKELENRLKILGAAWLVQETLGEGAALSLPQGMLTHVRVALAQQRSQGPDAPEGIPREGGVTPDRQTSLFDTHGGLVLTGALVCLLLLAACGVLAYHVLSRRKLENKLAAQVNFVSSLLAAMPTPVFYKDVSGIYQGCNPAFAAFIDMDMSQVVGHSVTELYPEEEAKVFKNRDDALFNGQFVQVYEYEKATPQGPRQIRFHKAAYRDAAGNVAGLVGVIADITDLRRAEKDLETTRNYLQAIIDSSPSVMFSMDEQGRITHANTNARERDGITPGMTLTDLPPGFAGLLEMVRKAIAEGRPQLADRRIQGTGCSLRAEEAIVYPLTIPGGREAVVRIDDVSEQHRMQEMLAQSEKMMSVGGLAAGMAHEINNPLGGVMQTAQVIANRLRPDLDANIRASEQTGCSLEGVTAYLECRGIFTLLEDLRESARRAAQVVSNMLEFSRRSTSAWLPADLNAIIERTLALCLQDYNLTQRYDFKKIAIIKDLAEPPLNVPCSPPQIQQVLFNLLRNAAQAMFQAGTPEPTITVRCRQEGGWAVLTVEDNGPGMEESVRRKVFEPFFTTKSPDGGSGLGLSVSFFIVHQNHGGEFEVESSPGRGARFILRLPMVGRRNGAGCQPARA